MGFFKKKKKKQGFSGMVDDDNDNEDNGSGDISFLQEWKENEQHRNHDHDSSNNGNHHQQQEGSAASPVASAASSLNDNYHQRQHQHQHQSASQSASIQELPSLINDLASCQETFAEEPARALRTLFALSEHHALHEIIRIRMINEANATLVPTLLQFLQQCKPNSSEQYLALLVLNNLSIPTENKGIIALQYKAVSILSRMLCWHPESSLICIILVNLSFCDAALRTLLVVNDNGNDGNDGNDGDDGNGGNGGNGHSNGYLVEAFSYALQVSIMPQQEQLPFIPQRGMTPRQLLHQLQQHMPPQTSQFTLNADNDDPYTATATTTTTNTTTLNNHSNINLPFSNNITHPETARWCLCGIKNLTRPSKDPIAAQALVQSGIIQVVLRVLSIGSGAVRQASNEFFEFKRSDFKGIGIEHDETYENDPYTWDSNSMQDAALYILMNLALTPVTRPHLRNKFVARKISVIARYSSSPSHGNGNGNNSGHGDDDIDNGNGEKQKDLQCLKARMTLAYLFGSEHHFGQAKLPPPPISASTPPTPTSQSTSPSTAASISLDSSSSLLLEHETKLEMLLIKGSEAPLLVELLANTLHGRGKPGAGGYNASTFNAKKALYAIRCLLTNPLNVKTFFVTCGVKLNVLLLKALALHSIQEVPNVDLEAAEDACFSMYLLSNHGFMASFLPNEEEGYPFENILQCYAQKKTCTAAGKHAAMQLLLRHAYLQFDGNLCDDDDEPKNVVESDLELGDALYNAALDVEVFGNAVGVEPMDDIFGRPLTRRKLSLASASKLALASSWTNGKMTIGTSTSTAKTTNAAVASFNSALDAVQELSFGSGLHDKRGGFIDDIEIANNIAMSANGNGNGNENSIESYGYEWSWQDDREAISMNETDVRKKLNDFRSGKMDAFKGLLRNVSSRERPSEPITIFGINCGCNSVVVD